MKKKTELAEMEDGPKLSKQQYLEWRCFIYAIDIAKSKAISKEYEILIQTKEIEINALKRNLMTRDLSSLQEVCAKAKKDYEKYRDDLGQLIGTNLDGAVIDPVSLQVKFLDQKESK